MPTQRVAPRRWRPSVGVIIDADKRHLYHSLCHLAAGGVIGSYANTACRAREMASKFLLKNSSVKLFYRCCQRSLSPSLISPPPSSLSLSLSLSPSLFLSLPPSLPPSLSISPRLSLCDHATARAQVCHGFKSQELYTSGVGTNRTKQHTCYGVAVMLATCSCSSHEYADRYLRLRRPCTCS